MLQREKIFFACIGIVYVAVIVILMCNCEIFHTQFSKGTEIAWHSHGAESEEIMVVLEGSMLVILENGDRIKLEEKDKLIIPKGTQHMAVIGDKPCQIIAMTIPKEKYE